MIITIITNAIPISKLLHDTKSEGGAAVGASVGVGVGPHVKYFSIIESCEVSRISNLYQCILIKRINP